MKSKRARTALFAAIGFVVFIVGAWWRYNHRPIPPPIRAVLYEGIDYIREVRTAPRPLVIHIVRVDLQAPGVSFLVTPGDAKRDRPFRARTTSQFLTEFHLQIAINGDFFYPWHSSTPWDYYPHVGDPVDVNGVSASRGVVSSQGRRTKMSHAIYISEDNRISFKRPPGPIYNAISGGHIFVNRGTVKVPSTPKTSDHELHPRTAVATDRNNERLLIAVIDGRQPNYSEGVTLEELGKIVVGHGGYTALELDGGGSTTLVKEGKSGESVQLNSPIDNRIPGRERPIANHLGVFARKRRGGPLETRGRTGHHQSSGRPRAIIAGVCRNRA